MKGKETVLSDLPLLRPQDRTLNSFFLSQDATSNLMAVKLFSRSKRQAQTSAESMEDFLEELEIKRRKLGLIEENGNLPTTDVLDEKKMREIVTIMIKDEIQRKQSESEQRVSPEFGSGGVIQVTEGNIQEPSLPIGGRLIPETGMDSLAEAIMEEIKRRTKNQTRVSSLGEALAPSEGLPTPGVIIGVPIEATSPSGLPPPPQVSVEELPSDSPGCRTLATKTCYQTPVIINKKVNIAWTQKCWRMCFVSNLVRHLFSG